jgi:hypothetical protein
MTKLENNYNDLLIALANYDQAIRDEVKVSGIELAPLMLRAINTIASIRDLVDEAIESNKVGA